ncbi:MAG TPA: hypothetical protein VHX13_08540 [Acidobacteriaceae bacterium]|jgi:hypothetical protein|nr:hypothetical protein [Acidobacteriaceae bacterium]
MRVEGTKRKLLALASLAVLAALAWTTMDPGRVRLVVVVLLGGFAFRISLMTRRVPDESEIEEPAEVTKG